MGYYHNCSDAVERTVIEYLTSLTKIANEYMLQMLVMPVAPHAYRSEKNGKAVGRARRRETMCLWNEILRRELTMGRRQALSQPNNAPSKYNRVFLLDYESRLQHSDVNSPVGYVLNPSYTLPAHRLKAWCRGLPLSCCCCPLWPWLSAWLASPSGSARRPVISTPKSVKLHRPPPPRKQTECLL